MNLPSVIELGESGSGSIQTSQDGMLGREVELKWLAQGLRSYQEAEAKAAAALRELGATLKASATAPKLKTLQLFKDLGLDEEEDELELNIMEEIASLVKNADGPAGDQVKYEHAVGSMVKRWKLFVALYDLGEQEPTHEMVKLFVGFMYT